MKGELRTFCLALFLFSSFITAHSWRCRMVWEDEPCDNEHIKFFLYTRNNFDQVEQISMEDFKEKIKDTHYDPTAPTKLLIPGQKENGDSELLLNLKNEYLKKVQANVVLVDYSEIAPRFCYSTSVFNVRYVGKCVANFVQGLKELANDKVLDLHVIGYRLGGHVPANVAPHLEPYKIPRITGLDPSFPFSKFKLLVRSLNRENADFVDVVHTAGLLRDNYWPLGHVDVYVNGGAHLQPGCRKGWWLKDWILANRCSHQRSLVYFTESVNSNTGFYGYACKSRLRAFWDLCSKNSTSVLIGDSVNTSLRGMFYVGTKSDAPFAMGNVDNSV
ncbi:pancreatic triacylglycerol lipase-like [Cimex lectularius]|uniref:Lipase domain-containing protein n=1 Tax=Cimex lectularius TaxID=79782 RepID=A0A8I6TFV9_CIMLE|nr:pancreatic triacylglycerol lipase-like [Cimex lectularius]